MATIADLDQLGYSVGLAHGSVEVEQDALDAARAAADPQAVVEQANTATADTLQTLANAAQLPENPADRRALASEIGAAALEMLTVHVNEQVDFHERALAIAQESPNVWHVEGPGFAGYVSCKEDGSGWDDDNQQILDALADSDSYAERAYQADNQDAMEAAQQLSALDVTITRPTLGADVWEAEDRTFTAAELPAFLDEVQARPPVPTTAAKVVEAIAAAPELSDATKAALTAALAPPQT